LECFHYEISGPSPAKLPYFAFKKQQFKYCNLNNNILQVHMCVKIKIHSWLCDVTKIEIQSFTEKVSDLESEAGICVS